MPQAIQLEIEMPGDLAKFRLPKGVAKRLQDLLASALVESDRPLLAKNIHLNLI